MKKQLIIWVIFGLCIIFVGCFESDESLLCAEILDYQPDSYYNLNNETLNTYPKLKKAIDQPDTWIPLTFQEEESIYNFIFHDNDAKILKYNGIFYEINLIT